MSDENIEVTEIESPFLQRVGEKLYSYKFPTKASIVSMEDGSSVEDAVSSAQETLGDVTAEQLAEAAADAHSHENKEDVLDKLGVTTDGELTFDGEIVGSGSGDGDGESSTRPWTAYGDGVDEAPERLRDGGVYVSDEAEAPEETAQAAVLRQKRDDELVPILPRTDGELVSVLIDGVESTNVAAVLTELKEQIDSLREDYMRKANDQFTAGYYGTVVEMDSASAYEVDPTKGSVFVIHNAEAEAAVSISGAVGAACVTVMFDNTAMDDDAALTWDDAILWPYGEVPAEVEAGAVSIFTFITPDAGTTWYGSINGESFGIEE